MSVDFFNQDWSRQFANLTSDQSIVICSEAWQIDVLKAKNTASDGIDRKKGFLGINLPEGKFTDFLYVEPLLMKIDGHLGWIDILQNND